MTGFCRGYKWTDPEKSRLAGLIGLGLSYREIAKSLFGRTAVACKAAAWRFGIAGERSYWTAEEDAAVVEHYRKGGAKLVARKCPSLAKRTPAAIRAHARDMGLAVNQLATLHEIAVINIHYADGLPHPASRAAKYLGIDRKRAVRIACYRGMGRDRKDRGRKSQLTSSPA